MTTPTGLGEPRGPSFVSPDLDPYAVNGPGGVGPGGRRGLPAGCDVILVQDSALAYELADRWPSTPQVFRACSYVYDFQFPAQLPGTVAAVVVLNDRMARHVAALDQEHDVVRSSRSGTRRDAPCC